MADSLGTTTIRTLIVDDEFRSRSSLGMLLHQYFPQIQVVGEAVSVEEGIRLTRTLLPDLVFLDVLLPDGTAFDFLQIVDDLHLKVIIVSAYSEHSLQAFKYATVHYLLKPVYVSDLREAIHRVSEKLPDPKAKSLENIPDQEKVSLPTHTGFKVVSLQDIAYCQAEDNYTVFHFADKSKHMVSTTLGNYEKQFGERPFFRVHHSFLVHLKYVKEYRKGRGGGSVIMANGVEVEVAHRRSKAFLKKLEAYLQGK